MNNVAKRTRDIADKHSAPFYLFDLDVFTERIKELEGLLSGTAKLCYAMKANPFLVDTAVSVLDRIEVCSFGEYEICRNHKIPASKLLISGVLKRREDLEEILNDTDAGCIFTVESWNQFKCLLEYAEKNKETEVNIIIRLTNKSQFGVDKEDLLKMILESKEYKNLKLRGIHYFSGTQKKNPDKDVKELEMLDELVKEVEASTGVKIEELEYGPGIPYEYFQDKEVRPLSVFAYAIAEKIREMDFKGTITIELGRALAASCGCYACKVLDLKTNNNVNYCLTEGGIHQLFFDGQIKGMYHPFIDVIHYGEHCENLEKKVWTVCGSLCTMNDVLTANMELGNLSVGDLLIFENTGAYSFAEGMALFLSHELPDIVGYSKEEGYVDFRKDIKSWPLNTLLRR